MVDKFGFAEFTIEFLKTVAVGGTIVGIPVYKTWKKSKTDWFGDLMLECGIKNKKNMIPLVIDKQEKEYGFNLVAFVPEGLCIDDFERHRKQIEHVVNGEIILENIGDKKILMKIITIKLEKQYDYVYKKLPLLQYNIGMSYMGEEILKLGNDDVSILVGGATGKGKSSLLRLLITQMILNNHNMIDLYLCDLARKEFCLFEKSKYVKKFSYDIKETLEILYGLKKILEERSSKFEAGINSIYKWNIKNPDDKWKFKVCFIDEFADITLTSKTLTSKNKVNADVQILLSELERKGRAVGIHFVLSTQHPNAETVPSIIKKHLLVRFGFSVSDRFASEAILDHGGAENILQTGRVIMKNSEGEKELQTYFLDEDICEELIKFSFIEKDKIKFNKSEEIIGVKRNGAARKR